MNNDEENLKIWNQVFSTPSQYVKPLEGKSYLSAIDAYYQIFLLTKTFGPCGIGWGYVIDDLKMGKEFVQCKVTVWYMNDGKKIELPPVIKMQPLRIGKQRRFDDDACTKVVTSALTKAISFLGFSADVFMGFHDRNQGC